MNLTCLVILPQADTSILEMTVGWINCLWRNYLEVPHVN